MFTSMTEVGLLQGALPKELWGLIEVVPKGPLTLQLLR